MANIELTQYINATPDVVYEALTTTKGLSEIWTLENSVASEVGGMSSFGFGPEPTTIMKITELTSNRRVAWECVESDPEWVGTRIVFELEDRHGKTALTAKHLDWRAVTEFFRSCGYNWGIFLLSLKQYCEGGQGLPYQRRHF